MPSTRLTESILFEADKAAQQHWLVARGGLGLHGADAETTENGQHADHLVPIFILGDCHQCHN